MTWHVTRKVLEVAGVKVERLSLDWASAAEAALFVELITKFTNRVKGLGPLGKAEDIGQEELKMKLMAARAAVQSVKLRTRFAKLAQELRGDNGHSAEVIEAKMAEKVDDAIVKEIEKQEKALAESGVQKPEADLRETLT